jgi:hypothetical protein
MIGHALSMIGSYGELNNKEQVVALIDEVSSTCSYHGYVYCKIKPLLTVMSNWVNWKFWLSQNFSEVPF